ncbi:phosphomevalonate kinase-like [Sinocyclocheilus grahami]|uniref:phosphomevalonate kinase-like n=1 Tax=Sinocyclocheilus grahami TaxID=75366 RepID=UPI0007AC985C|nr:PREDICTED: phosphomevalonate kinase-like [Sinocyclocheilus grahami]
MWNTFHAVTTMTPTPPRIILLFSGKRKSGKDYVTDLIQKRLTAEICCILRLSAPLKQQYAKVQYSIQLLTCVDDAESECGLDEGVKFDWIIRNDGADDVLEEQLEGLLALIKAREDSNTQNSIKLD